jgi:pimeloyl-ACP methyl ester carboxylesterase
VTKFRRVVLRSEFQIPVSDRLVLLQTLETNCLNPDTFLFRNSKLLAGERKNPMTNPAGHTSWKLATALIAVLIAATQADTAQAESEFDGKESQWHGFGRHDFNVGERACIVVSPETATDGKPWIWRARFFGHEPQADIEMLKRGYHIAYCDVGNLFGNPQAVKHWDDFYEFLTSKHGFAKKVALEGMSRGGLIIYNWAAANPDKVACLYGDAPVCDFKSWPGGKGKGKGGGGAWLACLKAYGLTEEQALKYDRNPIDQLKPLADAKIPILHVVGDADDVVPVAENSAIIEARYKALGGSITVISKPGVGHHPHALKDPTPIVEFFVKHTTAK